MATSYEFYSGNTSGSPVVHDINADLGRPLQTGYIKNTGATQSLTFAISNDGVNYGDEITLAPGEIHLFENDLDHRQRLNMDIYKLRISQVTSATSYKIYVD